MNQQPTPSRLSPPGAVDRHTRRETAAPAGQPALSAASLPRVDASEPAELALVAVRGYN